MDIKAILSEIKAELPQTTQLVAVSKFHPAEAIKEAYDAGQRIFGESKVQELEEKHNILPHDIQWHFIGHLQTNKVKYIAPYISMIHAVDSYKRQKQTGLYLACLKYTLRRRKQNSDSLPKNAQKCSKMAAGKN